MMNLERISETLDNQQQKSDELDNQEKEYQKMLKDYEKKEKMKNGEDNKLLEPEDYENLEIEKILEEEIRYEE